MVGQSGQHKDWYIPVFGSRISSTWTNTPPDQRYVAVDSGAEQDSVAGKSAVAAVATACPFKLKSLSPFSLLGTAFPLHGPDTKPKPPFGPKYPSVSLTRPLPSFWALASPASSLASPGGEDRR
jgi:hypothetical protein